MPVPSVDAILASSATLDGSRWSADWPNKASIYYNKNDNPTARVETSTSAGVLTQALHGLIASTPDNAEAAPAIEKSAGGAVQGGVSNSGGEGGGVAGAGAFAAALETATSDIPESSSLPAPQKGGDVNDQGQR